MTQEEILEIFKKTGALLEGHFILTSGYHSQDYFQCAKVLQFPEYNEKFSSLIADKFKDRKITLVISPAIGGIVFGTEVGRQLNARTIFTERENNVMTLRRGFEIFDTDRVLICEDVITTGGSVKEIIDIIKHKTKAEIVGAACIVDRSGGKINFDEELHSLAKLDLIKYKETEIPDWLQKIPVTKPGSRK